MTSGLWTSVFYWKEQAEKIAQLPTHDISHFKGRIAQRIMPRAQRKALRTRKNDSRAQRPNQELQTHVWLDFITALNGGSHFPLLVQQCLQQLSHSLSRHCLLGVLRGTDIGPFSSQMYRSRETVSESPYLRLYTQEAVSTARPNLDDEILDFGLVPYWGQGRRSEQERR